MIGKKKNLWRKIISVIIFTIGFTACSYPLISTIIAQQYQNDTVATYEKAVSESTDDHIKKMHEAAREYNDMLYETDGITVGSIETGTLNEENYNSILNVSGNGVIGSIEIPKIEVNLPIYHGTSEEVLNVGVGHVQRSSLPIGGENTRAVLTGHRGLPDSKLFTRLDELETGDMFYIYVLDKKLAYRVCDIEVIKPEEVERLKIQEGKDLITLLTCHPYGINTHRLIVTGERTVYEEEVYNSIESEMMSVRELIFAALPFVFPGIVLVTVIKSRLSKKKVNQYEIKGKKD